MNRALFTVFFILTCLLVISCGGDKKKKSITPKAKIKTEVIELPSSESIGKYTAGCVRNSAQLPVSGPGYQVIRLHRGRFYGHSRLVKFIIDMSYGLKNKYGTTLYIADISKEGGGPILDDHSSHQIGLDADILYIHKPIENNGFITAEARERKHPESTLAENQRELDYNKWSPVNEQILKEVSKSEEVDRIFVNPVIKKELCRKYPGSAWLRKLRPWWGHDGHFHVRMECPKNSPACNSGGPIPQGNGCGRDLAWWFSEDERLKRIEISKAPDKTEEDIILPEECADIVK